MEGVSSDHLKEIKPEDGDDRFWDYGLQEALNESIDFAMDDDGSASHPIYIRVSGRTLVAERVTVDRGILDECQITIHAREL